MCLFLFLWEDGRILFASWLSIFGQFHKVVCFRSKFDPLILWYVPLSDVYLVNITRQSMRLGDRRGVVDRWNLSMQLAWTETQLANLVPLRLFQKRAPGTLLWIICSKHVPAFLRLPKINFGNVFYYEHAQSHARYGLIAIAPKKQQTFDHPQMTDVPSFIGAFCEPNKLKFIEWTAFGCWTIRISCKMQYQTHKNRHTNQFAFQAHVKTSWAGPGQLLTWPTRCLTEGVAGPHWGRQPYSATVFRQPETLPNCRGETTVFRKMPSFQRKKMTRKVPIELRSSTDLELSSTNFPPDRKTKYAYDYKHMPKQHGNIKIFHSNPHATSCENMEVDIQKWRCVIRTPWSHMKWYPSMHIAKHANTKHISTMRLGTAIVLLAECGSQFLRMPCLGHNEGEISGMFKKSCAKQMNKPKQMVCSASTHAHARNQGL